MTSLITLKSSLEALERKLERERGIHDALNAKIDFATEKKDEAEKLAYAYEEASKLLAQFADEKQAEVTKSIENIVSLGLTQVFGEPMRLVIKQTMRARRLEFDILVKTGELETPVLDSRGGGLAAVTGFLLRAAVLLLTPGARRIMALDETFAMLSEEYLSGMADFLSDMCKQFALQILMVTHQPEFAEAADKVYRIEKVSENTSRLVLEK